ncbi:MAG TPA: hypothetical protein PKH02_04020 [Bacteroidales bacterium]|nr:hypothetical protein [Bacteroidales bacterium]HPT11457.1 hypothetical protein [Bacteroidales bacterium]
MRKIIFFAVVCLLFALRVDAQKSNLVPRSPQIRHDWAMGIVNIPEVGVGVGMSFPETLEKYNFYSITNVTGYQFTRNIKVGIGYGAQVHGSDFLIPIFGDIRVNPNAQGVVPFLAASGGVEMAPSDFNNNSRIFISGMVGTRIVTTTKICTDLSMGAYIKAGGNETKATFIVLKLGIEIKGKKNDALK